MSEQEQSSQTPSRRKKKEPLPPLLILLCILALVAAGAGIFFFTGERPGPEIPSGDTVAVTPVPDATPGPQGTLPAVEEEVGEEQASKDMDRAEAFVPGLAGPADEENSARECALLAEKLHGFFLHIDNQAYIQDFNLKEPAQGYFAALAYRLLDNPPVVSRESDDLYTILKNMAHFFRVIGQDNIILIKTILDRERDKIEDVAAELYVWASRGTCDQEKFSFAPSLAKMYEYAGFFLNTMGGRSYLFRRDSRSRLLVNYYSILLIDLANEQGINRHGIDIAQAIPMLTQEIESSNQLIYKENYLDQLYSLLETYQ